MSSVISNFWLYMLMGYFIKSQNSHHAAVDDMDAALLAMLQRLTLDHRQRRSGKCAIALSS